MPQHTQSSLSLAPHRSNRLAKMNREKEVRAERVEVGIYEAAGAYGFVFERKVGCVCARVDGLR